MSKQCYIYILASGKNGTLYIGVTSDLALRIYQHKKQDKKSFTQKYGVVYLVYYEICTNIFDAIRREKQLKHWKREWKIKLIESVNPEWIDLYRFLF